MSLSRTVTQPGARAARLAVAVLMVLTVAAGQSRAASRYWELGWGLYGGEGLDAARYDWHMICFGNIGANQKTVDGLNEILKINPRHKFLIRVWPIMGLGDCVQNGRQATLFHYWYMPGVREKVLAETKRQVELVCRGVSRPQNVYGCCFLEELPGHFTSCPFGGQWTKGDALPWDMKRFQKEIEAELGEPLDWSSEKHRLWWGRKYCQAIEEINRTVKVASGGKAVFYYQATAWNTLDHLELPAMKGQPSIRALPFSYRQILKPGACDGVFGYPNNATAWADQTQSIVRKYQCLCFSQISMPPGMRLCHFDEMVDLARWKDAGNVGAFLYGTHGRKDRAWNELDYQDESSYWPLSDHVRRFAWQRKIGQEIVDRALTPTAQLAYDVSQAHKDGFVRVVALVTNRRDPSWYGGSVEDASLRDVSVRLDVPRGFCISPHHSAPPTLKLGNLAPHAMQLAEWWIRVENEPVTIPPGQRFSVAVASANAPPVNVASANLVESIAGFQRRSIVCSGDRWYEPMVDRHSPMEAVVELRALRDVRCPQIGSAVRWALYRDVLHPGERLVIGPGLKARLYAVEPFDKAERQFPAGPDGAAVFSSGYLVRQSKAVSVRPGQKYRLAVTGWGRDGGNSLVLARFSWRDPKSARPVLHDESCLVNRFGPQETTASQEIEVPPTAGKGATLRLLFYRFQTRGTVCYRSFDCRRSDVPQAGLDVTGRLDGVLPDLEPPFTSWVYRDLSDADPYGQAKLELRFLSPKEIETGKP